jgi:TonB dependent receptor/TonB-dependent Receptor Plug Domain
MRPAYRAVAALALMSVSVRPALGQTNSPPDNDKQSSRTDIIVTAPKIPGSAIDDVPAELVLDEAAIEGYGASSVADLLSQLSPQTSSARGRGDGAPVLLINGQRISAFAEVRDLPPEAILRVEVLPEAAAVKYGFPPNQRVTNFILKPGFSALTGEAETGFSTLGDRREDQLGATYTAIGKASRTSLAAEYDRATRVLESERGIDRGTADPSQFRTLLPDSDSFKLNGTVNQTVAGSVSLTLNGRYEQNDTNSWLGLSPFVAGNATPLVRGATSRALHGGLTLDGMIAKWNWTLTANHDRNLSRSLTDSRLAPAPRDSARSFLRSTDAIYTVTGPLIELPAGKVQATIKAGFGNQALSSQSVQNGLQRSARLSRDDANVRGTLEIPLASRRGAAGSLGDLSASLSFSHTDLSDFGGLNAVELGLNWTPVEGLTLYATGSRTEKAPTINQLGDPLVRTPGVPVYDFARGQTVIVDRIAGGNGGLLGETQRDQGLGVSYAPPGITGLSISANYFRNRSTNPVAALPTLSPEVERAFPGRFIRDAGGNLVAIDQRPVNFTASSSDQLRWGVNFVKQTGTGAGAAGPVARPSPSGGPRPGGGGGGGGGGFGRGGFGRGNGSGWQVSLYHTVRFRDTILISPGLPPLDLLGGSATGASGGSPRHTLELESGWYAKGIGIRLSGTYRSGSRVSGGVLPGASDLIFSDILTLNARFFINFTNRKALVARVPFLKGSRLVLRIDNLTGAIRDVRDGSGAVPFSYQDGFLDPRGRFVEISFRKTF